MSHTSQRQFAEAIMDFFGELRHAVRSLVRAKGLTATVIATLALGIGVDNTLFSVPEILDLRSRVKTLSSLGDFSTIGFTLVGLGEPREVSAGVVVDSYPPFSEHAFCSKAVR